MCSLGLEPCKYFCNQPKFSNTGSQSKFFFHFIAYGLNYLHYEVVTLTTKAQDIFVFS